MVKSSIVLVFASLFLVACNPSNPKSSRGQIFEAGVGITNTSGDFGEMAPGSSKIQTYKITNTGDEPLVGPATLDNTNFAIIYQPSSCNTILPTKNCSLKVNFDAKNKAPGVYNSVLTLDSFVLNLTATIPEPPAEDPEVPTVLAQFQSSTSPASVITSIDYGALNATQSITKTIYIRNISSAPLNESVSISPNYSLIYDNCSGKNIAKNANCMLKVTLSAAGKTGIQAGTIEYAGISLSLTGEVMTPVEVSGNADIVFIKDSAVTTEVNYGSLTGTEGQQAIIYIKNIGTASYTAQTAVLNNSNFSIIYNQCSNKVLPINGQCQVRVLFSASGKANDVYSGVLTFGAYSLNLVATVAIPADVITFEPAYSDYGLCSASEPCLGEGTKSRTLTSCQKKINGVNAEGGTLADCASFETVENLNTSCLSPSGEKIVSIDYGTKTLSCLEGSQVEMFVSLSCNDPYVANNASQLCELPPPATPSADGLIIGGFSPQTYSTSLTQFVGFSNPQNVASAMFYEGTTCSGTALQSSLVFGTFYQAILPAGEGTRHMSARVSNSLFEEGNCVTSSIIVDTLVPSLSTTLASTTTNLASQAPNITFTYSDTGTGIDTVRYYVSKMPYSAENYDWNSTPTLQGQRELTTADNAYQGIYDPTYDEVHGQVGALYNLLPYNIPLYVIIEVKDMAGNYSYQSKEFTSTENLEFSFKYADTLPLPNSDEVITYSLNKAFLNQYYFSSSYGVEEYGDSFGQTKKYEADAYYSYYLPTDDVSCASEGGTWDTNSLFCDFDKDTCLSKGLIYASKGDGQAPVIGQGHCGVPQFKVGFSYADMQTVTGNAAYNEVLASFVFFRDECQVVDGILSCNFPPPTPPAPVEPTTAKVYYTSPSGVFTKRINLNDGSTIAGSVQTITNSHREDVNPTSAREQDMVYFNGHVFFDVLKNGSQVDRVLFKVNTADNTISQAADLFAPTNTNGGYYGSLVVCNNDLYYTGNSDIYGAELFRYNNGANNVINAVAGAGGLSPSKTTCVNNVLYFLGHSGAQTYLYKYDTVAGGNPVQLMNTSQEGNTEYNDLVYVPGQNKIYTLGFYNGLPSIVKFYDVVTNSQGTLAGTTWMNYGDYLNVGLGTDGTNLYISQAEIYVTPINRIYNYTTGTQIHYFTGSPVNYESTPVHHNNGRLFWSFNISSGSKKKVLAGAESTLFSGAHYIRKMEHVSKSVLFATTQGSDTSSPIYFFNTELMVNPANIANGVKFQIIPE